MRSVFTNEYWFHESWFGIQRHIYKVCRVSWLIVCNCGVGRIISFHFHELRGFSTSRGHNTHTDLGLKGLLLPWVTSNLVTCNLGITEDDTAQTQSDDIKINKCVLYCFYLSLIAREENYTGPLRTYTCNGANGALLIFSKEIGPSFVVSLAIMSTMFKSSTNNQTKLFSIVHKILIDKDNIT